MVRRGRTVQRGPRRKTVWAREANLIEGITSVTSFGANLLSTLESQLGAGLLGATVVRIRGVMSAVQTAGTVPGVFRVGGLVLPSATTVAAVNPGTEPFADWMLWESFLGDGAAFAILGDVTARTIDVKSMRKMEELDEELRIIGSAVSVDTTWSWLYDLSTLVMLP